MFIKVTTEDVNIHHIYDICIYITWYIIYYIIYNTYVYIKFGSDERIEKSSEMLLNENNKCLK